MLKRSPKNPLSQLSLHSPRKTANLQPQLKVSNSSSLPLTSLNLLKNRKQQ